MALSYDQKQKVLGLIGGNKVSAPVDREQAFSQIDAYTQKNLTPEPTPEKESIAERIANFTGGKELAQGAGQALASGTVNKLSEEALNRGIEMQTKLINAIKQAREIGNAEVEQRLTAQLKNIDFGQGIQEGYTDDMVSNREVIGSAVQLGASATGAFAGSKAVGATKGVSAFKQILAGAAAEGAVQGAGFAGGEELKQDEATLGSVAKETLKGGAIGAGVGIAGGAVIGGTLPAIGKVSQKLFPKGTLDEVIQKVTQKGSSELGKGSSKKLNKQVTEAIKLVDTSDVKTYSDLTKLFDDKATQLTKSQDAHLSQFTDKLDNNAYTLRKTTKGGNTVTKNYVDEAFEGLEDLYQKTNDIESLTDLQALRQQADAGGLTIKEINDVARTYGREIASKAYKTDAQGITTQVSSTTPESFEATRKGLKETIRESTPDQLSKQIDSEITDVISAKNRFAKLSDDVAQMNLKAQEVKGLGKIAKPILDLMDTLSFGFTKGALQALRKESGIAGKSYMNIIEAEKVLSKRLKNVETLMNKANKVTDEAGVKSILDSKLFKQVFDTDGEFAKLKQRIKETPNKQGGFVGLGKADNLVEQAKKFGGEVSTNKEPIKVFHGTGNDADFSSISSGNFDTMLDSAKKEASTGGNRLGLSTSTSREMAEDFAFSSRGKNVIEFEISPESKILDLKGKTLDDLSEADMKEISKNFDVVRDLDDIGGEGEIRILNRNSIVKENLVDNEILSEAIDSISEANKYGDDLDEAFSDFADSVLSRDDGLSYDELLEVWEQAKNTN